MKVLFFSKGLYGFFFWWVRLFCSLLIYPFPVNAPDQGMIHGGVSRHLMVNFNSTNSSATSVPVTPPPWAFCSQDTSDVPCLLLPVAQSGAGETLIPQRRQRAPVTCPARTADANWSQGPRRQPVGNPCSCAQRGIGHPLCARHCAKDSVCRLTCSSSRPCGGNPVLAVLFCK